MRVGEILLQNNDIMRILQAPTEIAGQMALLSEHLRKLGHKCTAYNFRSDIKIEKRAGVNIPVSSYQSVTARLLRALFFIYALPNYDYFHFHYGRTFLPKRLDIAILKLFNKKIILHFHGADVGNVDGIYYKNDKLLGLIEGKSIPPTVTEEQKKLILQTRKYADLVLVSTPDLLDVMREAVYFPNSLPRFEGKNLRSPEKKNQHIIIVHAPTNRRKKGTDLIVKVISKLLKEKTSIEFKLIENTDYYKARRIYQGADIAIDQLLQGWYGVFSIEMMALGKPVLCYIRDDLKRKYAPSLPVVPTNPTSLYKDLKNLISDAVLRKELGERGRRYVVENHSPEKQVKELVKLYKSL